MMIKQLLFSKFWLGIKLLLYRSRTLFPAHCSYARRRAKDFGPAQFAQDLPLSLPCGMRTACPSERHEETAMPKFVIEREILDAGKLPTKELQAISQKSCAVLQNMGPNS
jgi:hypothetical protein